MIKQILLMITISSTFFLSSLIAVANPKEKVEINSNNKENYIKNPDKTSLESKLRPVSIEDDMNSGLS